MNCINVVWHFYVCFFQETLKTIPKFAFPCEAERWELLCGITFRNLRKISSVLFREYSKGHFFLTTSPTGPNSLSVRQRSYRDIVSNFYIRIVGEKVLSTRHADKARKFVGPANLILVFSESYWKLIGLTMFVLFQMKR